MRFVQIIVFATLSGVSLRAVARHAADEPRAGARAAFERLAARRFVEHGVEPKVGQGSA